MPQADRDLQQQMEKRFGSLDVWGPEGYLKSRGWRLNKDWTWSKEGMKDVGQVPRDEFDCMLFLVHEWDYNVPVVKAETKEIVMPPFMQYHRKIWQIAELRPYEPGEDMERISISGPDKMAGSPKAGDMIARNPQNHDDQWLVAEKYFADNFERAKAES